MSNRAITQKSEKFVIPILFRDALYVSQNMFGDVKVFARNVVKKTDNRKLQGISIKNVGVLWILDLMLID